jgi:hypothetical protein
LVAIVIITSIEKDSSLPPKSMEGDLDLQFYNPSCLLFLFFCKLFHPPELI